MLLRLPQGLHYPITVTDLLKQPNDNVERFAPLFSYSYQTTVTEGDGLGSPGPAYLPCQVRVQHRWQVKSLEDQQGYRYRAKASQWVVSHRQNEPQANGLSSIEIAEIDEPCSHSVQFGGMCANCSQDMTQYVQLPTFHINQRLIECSIGCHTSLIKSMLRELLSTWSTTM